MSEAPTDQLADLPPSSKLVFLVLDREGPLTQQGIREESLLVGRTVRYAVSQLEENGLVEEQISFKDARKHIYSLSKKGEEITHQIPSQT